MSCTVILKKKQRWKNRERLGLFTKLHDKNFCNVILILHTITYTCTCLYNAWCKLYCSYIQSYHSYVEGQLYFITTKRHSLWISRNLTRQNQAFNSLPMDTKLITCCYHYIKLTYPSSVGKREFLATMLIIGTSLPSIK